MGRLRVLSGRGVCQILERHGFVEVRRRGSHVVMQRRTDTGTITVPVPDHREHHIGEPTLADAICDRLLHNAHRIVLKGPSRRKEGKLDS